MSLEETKSYLFEGWLQHICPIHTLTNPLWVLYPSSPLYNVEDAGLASYANGYNHILNVKWIKYWNDKKINEHINWLILYTKMKQWWKDIIIIFIPYVTLEDNEITVYPHFGHGSWRSSKLFYLILFNAQILYNIWRDP